MSDTDPTQRHAGRLPQYPSDHGNGTSIDPTKAYAMPPYCGTKTTPPCPADMMFYERSETIRQLAGTNATTEHVEKIAREVDQYIEVTLRQLALLGLRVAGR
jgi:hypothetical protein